MNQHNKPTIYWTLVSHHSWNIYIAATLTGLCFVGAQNGTFAELSQWTEKKYPRCILEENSQHLKPYMTEIIEYLDGKRTSFSMEFDFRTTAAVTVPKARVPLTWRSCRKVVGR